VLAYV